MLSCADSRVSPEILFDQGVGDLFVVRVAGNVAQTDEIGTIEYGTGHLGTPLLIVLGHSSCGAVKAVLEEAEVHGSIPQLIAPIGPAVEQVRQANPGRPIDHLLAKAVETNVWLTIDAIFEKSAMVRDLVKAGKLKVVGAVYDLATGTVQFHGEHREQARLLARSGAAEHTTEDVHASRVEVTPSSADQAAPRHGPTTTAAHATTPAIEHPTSLGTFTIGTGVSVLVLFLYGAHRYSTAGMTRWTVNARLTAGFASVLILLTGLAAISYVSMHSTFSDFVAYRKDARHGILAGRIQANFLEMRIAVKDFQVTQNSADIGAYNTRLAQLEELLKGGQEELADEPERHAMLSRIGQEAHDHAAGFATLVALYQKKNSTSQLADSGRKLAAIGERVDHEVEQFKLEVIAEQNRDGPAIQAHILHTQSVITWVGIAAVALGLGLAAIIARSITAPLRVLSQSLGEGAEQTSAAAAQVSASSQSLAEGASEQAASLEETSASLEELSSMTARNAEGAATAKQSAVRTRTAANSGVARVQALQGAMEAIKSSSSDITNILKTIDEIAFQTNILALNAAVEAARAGQHGAGFAVVADEVRALAQRSATAAKETALKIEHSLAKSEQGAVLSNDVATSFSEIQTGIEDLDRLVGEIASASDEQKLGIGQVSTAVSQMDQVTQTNAGSAEETAAAAEELSAQAVVLKEAVAQLQVLTGTRSTVQASVPTFTAQTEKPARPVPPRRPSAAKPARKVATVATTASSSDRFFQ
ncbi:MAG: hypothetical protein JNN01_22960 [Opitutaceae bacterium]|nr:hypothetical protein [Opitutaceae bacterium]